jgi:large subunit ribosomal protein L22
MLDKAIELLENVIEEKAWIPYRRHKRKRGHHAGVKWGAGGHPVKASQYVLKVLRNAEAKESSTRPPAEDALTRNTSNVHLEEAHPTSKTRPT